MDFIISQTHSLSYFWTNKCEAQTRMEVIHSEHKFKGKIHFSTLNYYINYT